MAFPATLAQATDLASLKSKLGGGYGDIEGFLRFFSLYPNNVRQSGQLWALLSRGPPVLRC